MGEPFDDDFDLDDGATEVVAHRPRRRGTIPIESETIAKAPAGGGVSRLIGAADSHRRDFLLMRKAGSPPVKIALAHVLVFKMLWTGWEAKRVAAEEDPGVAIAEIAEMLEARGQPMATSSISAALRSLARNGACRSIDQYVGWRSRRTRYYPIDAGVQAFALAEVLGEGSFVQVGRTAKAWKSRSDAEPSNLFQHAAFLRGGWVDPPDTV